MHNFDPYRWIGNCVVSIVSTLVKSWLGFSSEVGAVVKVKLSSLMYIKINLRLSMLSKIKKVFRVAYSMRIIYQSKS